MNRGLKVLLVDSGRQWRGGQQQVYLLARGLKKRGHVPHLVAPAESPLASRVSDCGIGVTPLRGAHDLDIATSYRLGKLATEFGADVIHCHDSRAHSMGRIVTGVMGVPAQLVVTRRTTNVPSGGRKYGGNTRFIAISNAVFSALVSAGIPKDAIDIVHSGIELATTGGNTKKRSPRSHPGDYQIVTIAALEEEKGLDVLLEAAVQIQDTNKSVKWTVVGDGAERDNLAELQRKHRLPVKFVGWQKDVAPFLVNADLMVHPARSEALGTAILEALSHGVPVIASRVGGIPEIVDETVGRLVNPDNPGELGKQVLACLENQTLRDDVLIKGPLLAGRFGASAMIDGVIDCYGKCYA